MTTISEKTRVLAVDKYKAWLQAAFDGQEYDLYNPKEEIINIVPAASDTVAFNLKGEPLKVIGYALCSYQGEEMMTCPICQTLDGLPKICTDAYFRVMSPGMIFTGLIKLKDIDDLYDLYRKNHRGSDKNHFKKIIRTFGLTFDTTIR